MAKRKKIYNLNLELIEPWDIKLDNLQSTQKIRIPTFNSGLVFEFDFTKYTTASTIESTVIPYVNVTSGFTISGASLTLFDNRTITPYAV